MRYTLLIPAIILDVVQFILFWTFWGLEALTPAGGGVSGAAAGAYLCYNASTGVISGILAGIKCAVGGAVVGAGLSAIAGPLGMVLDTSLSITIGGALIIFMAMEGMFYFDIIFPSFMGEALPLFNFLPFWTFMVWRCASRKSSEAKGTTKGRGGGIFGTAFAFAAAAGTGGLAGKAAVLTARRRASAVLLTQSTKDDQPAQALRISPALKTFDGIKPANDNVPQPRYAKAA